MTPDKKPNPKAETTSMVLNGIMIGLGEIPCLGIFEGSYNESAESFLDDAGDSAMLLCHHMLVRPKVLDGGSRGTRDSCSTSYPVASSDTSHSGSRS